MGISITQPAPLRDPAYAPRIIGAKRLWGGYNHIADQLLQAGNSMWNVSDCFSVTNTYFVLEEMASVYTAGSPSVFFNPQTGEVEEWFLNAPPSVPQRENDLTGRYTGEITSITRPTTYDANSEIFQTFDQLTGIRLPLPVTQSDLNAINEVASHATSSEFVAISRLMSPLADYILISFNWSNDNNEVAEVQIAFQAIFGTDPWT